jgi:predicted nucleic acid-binding protein
VTRYLLDTNILSNIVKPVPSPSLSKWLKSQKNIDLFISVVTLAEIKRGILEMPTGKKRRELDDWFDSPAGPPSLFKGRILPFDHRASLLWAQLMAEASTKGRPRAAFDTMIAAIAVINDCIIVTDNEKDFSGHNVLNPLRRV